MKLFGGGIFVALLGVFLSVTSLAGQKGHGFSYFGNLKYPPDFQHYDYVNPDAPKGGSLVTSSGGNFDSFNPVIRKGRLGAGLGWGGRSGSHMYDRLMEQSDDELASYYGLLAEYVELADDYSWISFRLREEARWHDGKPITVEDVLFTFDMIKEHGSPVFKAAYRDVLRGEQTGPREVTFYMDPPAATTPRVAFPIASMHVLPKHHWSKRDFTETSLAIPLGSGPYRIREVDPGRKIVYERVPDYWARDLPVNRGRYNIGTITYEYYNDSAVVHEARKAGWLDIGMEITARRWATGYDFEALDRGLFVKRIFNENSAYGILSGTVFNMRLPKFQDRRVREALSLAYNFEWANRVLHHNYYRRNISFFDGTDWVAKGLPSEDELKLLMPFKGKVPPRVFTEEFQVTRTEGHGYPREHLLRAIELFKEAGWEVRDGKMVNMETGAPFTIDFIFSISSLVRNLKPYAAALERMGIDTTVKLMEASQYGHRILSYDFEATVAYYPQEQIPGQRLRLFFGSYVADEPHGYNVGGIKDPVVDYLIEKVNASHTRQALAASTAALDRVLLWNFYVVPGFVPAGTAYVFWDKFGFPENRAKYDFGYPHTWWVDPVKARRVTEYRAALGGEGD